MPAMEQHWLASGRNAKLRGVEWNRTHLGPAVGPPTAHGGSTPPQKSMSAFWRKADISNVLTNAANDPKRN